MRHISILSLLMLLLTLLFGITGCGNYKGNGVVEVERRSVGSFHSVLVEQESGVGFSLGKVNVSGFRIKLIKDTAESVSIEYDENLMHHIKTESVNDKLIIRTKKRLYSKRDIHINIYYKELDHIDASSFARIIFATPYEGKDLKVSLSGACGLEGEIFAERLSMDVSGAADINIKGKVRKVKGEFSGAGTLNAFDLLSDTCMLDIAGAADAKVSVAQYLKVEVAGAGEVIYKGDPTIDQNVAGAGDIKRFQGDSI
jgi:hypothetical protein